LWFAFGLLGLLVAGCPLLEEGGLFSIMLRLHTWFLDALEPIGDTVIFRSMAWRLVDGRRDETKLLWFVAAAGVKKKNKK